MSKQTVVSQIFAQMKAGRKDTKFWNDTMVIDWLFESEEWLKKMEKEQMKEAALDNVTTNEKLRKIFEIQFEDFYKETYGGQDE
jgi:uncharacterized radical SAM superfamily protein